jgi:predicted DCC family thiol-disulfide oxidoreductase YuxK
VRTGPRPIVFYDGACGLCHRSVRVLLALDREGALRFAPIGGPTYRAQVGERAGAALPDSLVLRTAEGRLLTRSAAVVESLRLAGGAGGLLAAVVRAVPRPLADRLYAGVARLRARLFAPPPEACPRVPRGLRERFLP